MDSSLVIFTLITHLANLTNQNPNLRPAPLNKRILFRIVTTIPQQSRNNPAESPHSLYRAPAPPPHMSLKPGHIAHFDGVSAPHVPQTRTHGALQRPLCPTCPSAPDTWRASTPHRPTCPSNPDKWCNTLWHWHLSKFFKDIHNLRVP